MAVATSYLVLRIYGVPSGTRTQRIMVFNLAIGLVTRKGYDVRHCQQILHSDKDEEQTHVVS